MTLCSIEARTRKYVKEYGFFSFARNLSNKYRKQLLDTGLDTLKHSSRKVVCKAAEAMGEFLGNKFADAVAKSKNNNIVK